MFRSDQHFGLNLKDLVQVQKQVNVVKWHLMKYSKDPQARLVYDYRLGLDRKGHIGRGQTTSSSLTIERVERSFELEKILGAGQRGHAGLGFQKAGKKPNPRERIISRLKEEAEEKRLVILYEYQMQASWLQWACNSEEGSYLASCVVPVFSTLTQVLAQRPVQYFALA